MLTRATALVSLVLLVCALPRAHAKHDYEYAMALANRLHYYDLAYAEFKRMVDSGDPVQKRKGEFGIAQIVVVQARGETDNAKKLAAFDDALAKMEALIGSGGPTVADNRFALGELYIEKSKFLLERAEKETDKADALKDGARGALDKAGEHFKKVAEDLEKSEVDADKVTIRRSLYYQIECDFEKAVTYPLAHEKRQAILKSLKERVEQFCWANEEYIEAYFAYTILGQALTNVIEKTNPAEADLEEAFAQFDTALGIPLGKGTEWCRTLAYSRYMAECNRFGFYDRALGLAKKLHKDYENVETINYGQAAVIQEATAYWGKRDMGTAIAIVGKIAQQRTYWGSKAQLLLGKWQSIMGSSQTPDEAFLVAEGLRRERSYGAAVRSYQAVVAGLEKAKNAELDAKLLVKSWEFIAFSFKRLGLPYEAYHALMAASAAAQKLGDSHKAAENAYLAFTTIKSRSYSSKAESDAQLALETREHFLKNFPTSPYEPGIRLQLARDLEEAGKYGEAVAAYSKIDKQTEFYEEALSRVGICWYRQMKQQIEANGNKVDDAARASARDALAGINAYLEYVKTKPAGAADDDKRQDLLAQEIYYQGSVHDRLEEDDKVLEVLKDFETRFEKADPNLIGASIVLRIDANLTQGLKGTASELKRRFDLADADLGTLKRVAGNTTFMGSGYQRVGFAYLGLAQKERDAKNADGALKLEREAAKYIVPWALRTSNIKYEHLKLAAIKCYVLGKEGDAEQVKNAIRLLEMAIEKYPAEVEKDRNDPNKDKQIDLKYYLGECYFQTEQWAKAMTMLRDDYAKNPDSPFAIRSLGRCYFEVGHQGRMDAKRYDEMILDSRKEELGLLDAMVKAKDAKKKDWLTKLVVQRASQIYAAEKSKLDKKPFSSKDFDAFQRQWLAYPAERIATEFKNLVDNFYLAKRKSAEGLTNAREIALQAGLFALDRALYYYRLVGANSPRQGKEWWFAKYYTIAAQYEQGRAHHLADPEGGDTYKKGNAPLEEAKATLKNITGLFPNIGCTTDKPDQADPELTAMFTKIGELIREEQTGSGK